MKSLILKVSLLALIGSCWLATGLMAQAQGTVRPNQGFCAIPHLCNLWFCGWGCYACCEAAYLDCVYLANEEWEDCVADCDPESPEYQDCIDSCDYWHITELFLCMLEWDHCYICCEPCP